MTPAALETLPHDCPAPGTREKRLQRLFIRWESWKRRQRGGQWPGPVRGQVGAVRAARLLAYLRGEKYNVGEI